jgi:hypothetical protein
MKLQAAAENALPGAIERGSDGIAGLSFNRAPVELEGELLGGIGHAGYSG